MTISRQATGLLLTALLVAATSADAKRVRAPEPLETARQEIPEDQLLDVGIAIFEPNIPDEWEEQESENILPDVRRAEARYLPQVLKATLEESRVRRPSCRIPRGSP